MNNPGSFGRWAFVELTDIYQIGSDFEARVEGAFAELIDRVAGPEVGSGILDRV